MLIKTIFAGFGGQGVLSMGLNLAQAAMLEDKNVTYLPAYGAEVRGGTANCTVSISDEEIASPVASSPEYVVALNRPSVVRFQHQIESGGVFFVNSSLVDIDIPRGDIVVIKIPASQIAEDLGSARSTNMVMLGAFTKKSNLVSFDSLIKGLEKALKGKKKIIDINAKALKSGYDLL